MRIVMNLSVLSLVAGLAVGCETPEGSDESKSTKEESTADEPAAEEGANEEAKGEAKGEASADSELSADQKKRLEGAIAEKTPFGKERLLKYAQALQGSWVTQHVKTETRVAWRVDGAEITSWDGSKEKTMKLRVAAPCLARIEEGAMTMNYGFAVGDEHRFGGTALHAGVLTEDGFVACTGGDEVHVKTAEGCKLWKRAAFSWKSSESKCSMQGDEARVRSPDTEGFRPLDRVGDVLIGAKPEDHKLVSYPSFEKAKAAIDE